ncbi:lytic polysaccharide monooxygenase auxiliary activity family 9 protein [Streptomyces rishiriensis]|uniref:lytic polysaccharide monooxygenase auxiliary activity family 9 protein n=1 Tax=Streptomyces rishiriensis TaxID=68264 RepID=UPI000D5983DB|nr:lytic polysaccharide monooxygenase auxiliary activity family 9 protein [Streptomyces rishiriensis]
MQQPHPADLRAVATYRDDGDVKLEGISLTWRIGANTPDQGTTEPSDWNNGRPDYPHHYEVWLDGRPAQTVDLYWATWYPHWQSANRHWVSLGETPAREYRVKIRARHADGAWGPFTDEVTVDTSTSTPYNAHIPARAEERGEGRRERHGSLEFPASRAIRAIRDEDDAPICQKARELNTSTTWQEVVPPGTAGNPPWNEARGYLEYRKFFQGANVASAANPAFQGLDLAGGDGLGDWPTSTLEAVDGRHTFTYNYRQNHMGPKWTHQWFITTEDWDPAQGISWDVLEPTPFMVEYHGGGTHADQQLHYTTEALASRRGRHAIVNIWGGGDAGHDFKGEFFVSVSDVEFR